MKYPNAFKGVSKIFTAEILALIGKIASVVAGVTLFTAGASVLSEDGTGAMVGGGLFLIFGIAAVVLGVISTIFVLIGCNAAGKDEPKFKTAFFAFIGSLILTALSGVFATDTMLSKIFEAASSAASLCGMMFIIMGIINLADALGRSDLVQKGNTLQKIIMVVIGIAIIVEIVSLSIDGGVLSTIGSILYIAASVLGIIGIIIYLVLLKKAKVMLQEN